MEFDGDPAVRIDHGGFMHVEESIRRPWHGFLRHVTFAIPIDAKVELGAIEVLRSSKDLRRCERCGGAGNI